MKWLLLAVVAVGASACNTRPAMRLNWVDAEVLQHDARKYPDVAAVQLHRSDHVLLVQRDSEDDYTQVGEHVVWYIQKEAAFDLAEVKVRHWANDKLVSLKARIIDPDGRVRELEPAMMLSDANGKGERDVNAQYFRFPQVQVGSILEYHYVVEGPHLRWSSEQDTVGKYPVKRYQFDVTAPKAVRLELKEYNASFPIEKEKLPDGSTRFSCVIRDIPGQETEAFSPDWTFTQPRWALRLVRFVYPGSGSIPAYDSWEAMIRSRAIAQTGRGKNTEDFAEKLNTEGCTDVTCKVNRALKFVRERTRPSNSTRSARPLKEVLETKEATVVERAILAAWLLNDVGVETRLAGLTEAWTEQVDPAFPLLTRFNYLLLQVRPQGELKEPLWVDASRDDLKPGELDASHLNAQALTYRVIDRGPIEPLLEAEWAVTQGKQGPVAAWRFHHRAKIETDGTLNDLIVDEHVGFAARNRENDDRPVTETAFQEAARKSARQLSPLARLSDKATRECKPEQGSCRHTLPVTVPGYAYREPKRYSVPLQMLWPTYTSLFTSDERVQDVVVTAEGRNEEVVELEVPAGFALTSKPIRLSEKSGAGFDAELTIEPTPTGAKVTRVLHRHLGGYSKSTYPQLQKTLRLFQDARRYVLTFESK